MLEAEWDSKQRKRTRANQVTGVLGSIGVGLTVVPAAFLARLITAGYVQCFATAAIAIGLGSPVAMFLVRHSEMRERGFDLHLRRLTQDLADAVDRAKSEASKSDQQAKRQEFQSRLANAFDMVDGEPEAIDIVSRSLLQVLPGHTSELLLADNSHAHLIRMARVGPRAEQPGCSVDSPNRCPAAKRAQAQLFPDSFAFDACPKLRARGPDDRVSAVCIPVPIMGRAVGVLHSTGAPEVAISENDVEELTTLAKMAGSRVGMLRVMAETQLQAATDSLTGLLNRRSFEKHVSDIRSVRMPVTIAMADLDHFKSLNDTHGHDAGDRALMLFSRVARESLRGDDIVCRYGGEEFAIAFPSCAAADAKRALDSLRARLDAAITVNGLPSFTCSFGVTALRVNEDLHAGLRRADNALFTAKRGGRDRVVLDCEAPGEASGDLREDPARLPTPAEVE